VTAQVVRPPAVETRGVAARPSHTRHGPSRRPISPHGNDRSLLSRQAAEALEGAPAEDVLRWAADTFGEGFCLTGSMSDTVLAHLASQVVPGIRVVFLDTGYHFAETLGTRDAVDAAYDVEVETVRPSLTVAEQDTLHGTRLHDRDPDLCCRMRKVLPLDEALAGYEAWGTGMRRDESPTRRDTPVVRHDARRDMVKVAPLARWTADDVDAYAQRHGLVVNPLTQLGYPSIGCAPCTSPVAEGDDPRSGRWAGSTKTECGLHT
jgi:phosphoadenosine phosphosulfate reductase